MARISITQNSYAASRKNNHHKLFMKMHEIARMRAAQVKDEVICEYMRINRNSMSRIIRMKEYVEIQENVFNELMGKFDEGLAGRVNVLRTSFAPAVPLAMKVIMDSLGQSKDLRVRLEAAKLALDLDPNQTLSRDRVRLAPRELTSVPDSIMNNAVANSDSLADSNLASAKPITEVSQ